MKIALLIYADIHTHMCLPLHKWISTKGYHHTALARSYGEIKSTCPCWVRFPFFHIET